MRPRELLLHRVVGKVDDAIELRPKEAKRLIGRVVREHKAAELKRDRLDGCSDFREVRNVLVEAGIPRQDVERTLAAERDKVMGRRRTRRRRPYFIGFVLVVFAATALYGVRWVAPRYDAMVAHREDVRREWAQIDATLQRRYELIPNLVETVGGYAAHEAGVLTEMADAHSGYKTAQTTDAKMQASYAAERSIRGCMMLGTRYPALRADKSFMRLMDELAKAENQILAQRMKYNDTVSVLNAELLTVDGRIVGALTDLEVVPYYNPPEATEALPMVQFAGSAGSTVPAPIPTRQPPPSEPEGAGAAPVPQPAALSTDPLEQLKLIEVNARKKRATLLFPNGASKAVRHGQRIPGFDARVVGINKTSVQLQGKTVDESGRTVRRTVRLPMSE